MNKEIEIKIGKNIKLASIITAFFNLLGTIKYNKSIIGKKIYKNVILLNTMSFLHNKYFLTIQTNY